MVPSRPSAKDRKRNPIRMDHCSRVNWLSTSIVCDRQQAEVSFGLTQVVTASVIATGRCTHPCAAQYVSWVIEDSIPLDATR